MTDTNKIFVQRANVVLQISEQQVDYYLSQGYSIINENGEVIQASVPKDLGTLQKAYVEHLREIEELKKQLDELSAQKSDDASVVKRASRKKQQ